MGAETTEILTENLMFPSIPLNQAPPSPPTPVDPEPPAPQDPSAPFIGYATGPLSHEPQKKSKKKVAVLLSAAAAALAMAAAIIFFFVLPGTELEKTDKKVTGYGISVNGQAEIFLSGHEEAEGVLEELKKHYSTLAVATGSTVSDISVTYEETIDIVETEVAPSEIKKKQDALDTLINGKTESIEHMVEGEETVKEIAQKYKTTAESILAENTEIPELTPESKLEPGAKINVLLVQPYLNVIVKGTFEITEEIDFETEKKKDASVHLYTTEVKQEGEKGSKHVTSTYIAKNGVLIDRTILSETVTKKPVNEIILEGTTPLTLNFNSKTIDDAKLASMVQSGEIPSHVVTLNLSGNQISNISPLQSLTNLSDLNLSGNRISDVASLRSLTKLTRLTLSNNTISNLASMESLTGLTYLDLRNNEINNISSLGSLTRLTELNLSSNKITDIMPLRSLKNLDKLTIFNNPIQPISQVIDLQKDLPNCTII
jgi:Leucine-rich repeat (LRR) protein